MPNKNLHSLLEAQSLGHKSEQRVKHSGIKNTNNHFIIIYMQVRKTLLYRQVSQVSIVGVLHLHLIFLVLAAVRQDTK